MICRLAFSSSAINVISFAVILFKKHVSAHSNSKAVITAGFTIIVISFVVSSFPSPANKMIELFPENSGFGVIVINETKLLMTTSTFSLLEAR
ncbi:hypothetical protein HYU07_07075 [Candidatus Woesearchaeota archaeon]|nr:hypothetical protein [Candidatus Woesearchaeota archaeon]